ncbi:carboxylesterase family protein [Mycolicibacterium goodii]|uniref:carboxylesterase family protein n=1 Tax=Mycolicibacterium goodii TaxID=134601 RepID=UPI001BDD6D6E|nr:carboxylesterase family protein [Mycolicibacterium goodii]MBU8819679.1 carboxylesterase family protein [Mycolicibacterium goodii]MBU8833983.1 carboxylesterase family protein [Mycolicibacterium goodii]
MIADPAAAIVQTADRLIRGSSTSKTNAYKGIRYDEDTSSSRLSPAVSVRPWVGVREATELGPPFSQRNPDTPPRPDPRDDPSEDCLFLNVWSPRDASGLSVMVWIHGGAYEWGSGGAPMYAVQHWPNTVTSSS